jgi:hypothetical protein
MGANARGVSKCEVLRDLLLQAVLPLWGSPKAVMDKLCYLFQTRESLLSRLFLDPRPTPSRIELEQVKRKALPRVMDCF